MPPRSYFTSPRVTDYLAYCSAFFPDEYDVARTFMDETGLPYIRSELHISAYLGVSSSLIRQILHNKKYHYRTFPITKRDGSERTVHAPKTYLKVIHWWILDNILRKAPISDHAHGFSIGRGYLSNAQAHVGCNHILNVDIENFFPSIDQRMIYGVFRGLGFDASGARLLMELTSLQDQAPTGAPTSPYISNILLKSCDNKLASISETNGIKYTRYADDMVFSSSHWISDTFLGNVTSLINSYGFKLNTTKTQFMGTGDRMEVTGLVINNGRVSLNREWRNWARGYVHKSWRNPAQLSSNIHVLTGIHGTLRMIDPDGEYLLTQRCSEAIQRIKSVLADSHFI